MMRDVSHACHATGLVMVCMLYLRPSRVANTLLDKLQMLYACNWGVTCPQELGQPV